MSEAPRTVSPWWRGLVLLTAAAAVVVVGWAFVTGWGAVVHGHPAYAVLLLVTLISALAILWRGRRSRPRRSVRRRVGGVVLLVLGVGWVAAMAWLRPFTAVEPALSAMRTDAAVTVTESPTQIVMAPKGAPGATGLFFQPGALVDARAYAAVLRPVAEAGHLVVITKQPLGIAFLALPAFDGARSAHPDVTRWVVGGHSLGGTVAAMEADGADSDATAPAAGLLLYASYPASDIRTSLAAPVTSVSGSMDGLATPAKIEASRSDLPPDTTFTVVEGAAHAQFGDYGPQPGDGTPTISHDEARTRISDATVRFVDGLG